MIDTLEKTKVFTKSIEATAYSLWDKFKQLRSPFLEQLNTTNFPTTKDEYWKYTRTTKIARSSFNFPTKGDKINVDIPVDAYVIHLNNGLLDQFSAIDNDYLSIQSFENIEESILNKYFGFEQDNDRNIFNLLNSAYFTCGLFIEIKKELDKPIYIVNQLSGTSFFAQPRKIILGKAFAKATIIEHTISQNCESVLLNGVTEVFLKDNSNINYLSIQNEQEGVYHVDNVQAHQDKNTTFSNHTYSFSGDWIRNNINVWVNGQNCETNMFGAYNAKNKQTIDNHTTLDHRVANCLSNELYKGTASDKSTVTFNGKVFVRKDAQKINAFQSNNNILLSDDATINSKPELEIYADDVKCSHGSTTGQLDEEALFYLRSRGLSEASANNMLVGAFVGEVIENVEIPELRAYIKSLYGLE